MRGKRQNIQYSLALELSERGETLVGGYQGTEPPVAKPDPESPALAEQLMEEMCGRENCETAWKHVRAACKTLIDSERRKNTQASSDVGARQLARF